MACTGICRQLIQPPPHFYGGSWECRRKQAGCAGAGADGSHRALPFQPSFPLGVSCRYLLAVARAVPWAGRLHWPGLQHVCFCAWDKVSRLFGSSWIHSFQKQALGCIGILLMRALMRHTILWVVPVLHSKWVLPACGEDSWYCHGVYYRGR